VMIKAILKGILKYISLKGNPLGNEILLEEWEEIYLKLNIQDTDWDWSRYTNPRDTSWYKDSEALASRVFITAFETEVVPDNCINFQECILFGNNFSITFQCSDGTIKHIEQISGNRTINRPGIKNFRIIDKSENAEIISLVDKRTTANFPEWYKMDYSRDDDAKKQQKKGIDLPQFRPSNKKRPRDYDSTEEFTLEIQRVKYGGNYDSFDVNFII
jgi:hypothetical protein